MYVDLRFTGDGILAFAGGACAIIAVLLNNRQSRINLQRQLDAEKQAQQKKEEAEKSALASALLAEIDTFYGRNLECRTKWFDSWEKMKCDPANREVFVALVGYGGQFPVYKANANKIGSLNNTAARAVVLCWDILSACLELLHRYEDHLKRKFSDVDNEVEREMTSKLQEAIKELARRAIQITIPTCQYLAQVAGTDFQKLAIAKEATTPPISL